MHAGLVIELPPALALARDVPAVPAGAMLAWELKYDGWRAVLAVGEDGEVQLYSRAGRQIRGQFPELAAAGESLQPGTAFDGEIVIWSAGRLDFGQVQRRGLSSPSRAAALARDLPAAYVAFDVLALRGEDVRPRPWTERRELLEQLLAPVGPPIQAGLATRDRTVALAWFEDLAAVGVEGLVAKPVRAPYRPGFRSGWMKTRHATAVDGVVIAVSGPAAAPTTARVRLAADERLAEVAVPPPLRGLLAAALAEAGPGGLVVELRSGTGRHGTVRLARLRPDVEPPAQSS